MKKVILLATGFILSIASFAQLSIGLQGTGNLSDAKVKKQSDMDFRKKVRAMPGGGIVVQYDINKNVAIRSGANYLQNGVTLNVTVGGETDMQAKLENKLNYVQVPLTVMYMLPFAGARVYVGAGGFVNYGISGKVKGTFSYTMPDGEKFEETEETDAFKKEEDNGANFKRTEYGLQALAGIELPGGLFANLGYQHSLSNIDRTENSSYKSRGVQLTIGYFFSRR